MANVSTIRNLIISPSSVVVYVTIFGAATVGQETDMVIYDSSVIATALGITDPLDSTILGIQYSTSSLTLLPYLEFDANTDVLAWALPGGAGATQNLDFRPFGGLPNYASTGKTGDITLTTTGLDTNGTIFFTLWVRPN
jgi:hypothetical protein